MPDDLTSSGSAIRVQRDGGVASVVIDRAASRNALDHSGWEELLAALRGIAGSAEDRVVVLSGAGGHFCAGADLKEGSAADGRPPVHPLARMDVLTEVVRTIARMPQPTIAAVRGSAVGGGCGLALACDVVVAAASARFGFGFGRVGLSPDMGVSWTLPRLVGLARAKSWLLSARVVEAAEAAEAGLVAECVRDEQLDERVAELAAAMSTVSPLAARQTSRLVEDAMGTSLDAALDREAAAQVVNMRSRDFKEAVVAFAERRPPVFVGR